jgi:predicted transcriptional regulator
MSVSISIPIDLFERLCKAARGLEQTPDAFLIQTLTEAVEKQEEFANDPLLKLAGFIDSGEPIPADQYDAYLAEAIADNHNDEPDE